MYKINILEIVFPKCCVPVSIPDSFSKYLLLFFLFKKKALKLFLMKFAEGARTGLFNYAKNVQIIFSA